MVSILQYQYEPESDIESGDDKRQAEPTQPPFLHIQIFLQKITYLITKGTTL